MSSPQSEATPHADGYHRYATPACVCVCQLVSPRSFSSWSGGVVEVWQSGQRVRQSRAEFEPWKKTPRQNGTGFTWLTKPVQQRQTENVWLHGETRARARAWQHMYMTHIADVNFTSCCKLTQSLKLELLRSSSFRNRRLSICLLSFIENAMAENRVADIWCGNR